MKYGSNSLSDGEMVSREVTVPTNPSAVSKPLPSAESSRAAETWERKVERENQRVIEEMNRANQAYEESQRRAAEERRQGRRE